MLHLSENLRDALLTPIDRPLMLTCRIVRRYIKIDWHKFCFVVGRLDFTTKKHVFAPFSYSFSFKLKNQLDLQNWSRGVM